MKILKDAIKEAGKELVKNHDWMMQEGGKKEFLDVVFKHVGSLFDSETLAAIEAEKRAKRIAALKAELATLEGFE